jgi:D-tyrosyl-tRNA(Tyr) deacylase
VEGLEVGRIGLGYVVLLGIHRSDNADCADALAEKIVHLRLFDDEQGRINRSIRDVGGSVLSVSQFTLYGDTTKGRRPSFLDAASPDQAAPLYERFNHRLRELGVMVETGRFQAKMIVEIHNDGPVTLLLDTEM